MIKSLLEIWYYYIFLILILMISEIFKIRTFSICKTLLFLLQNKSKYLKKIVFCFVFLILGVLPIPGRIIIIDSLLNTFENNKDKFGNLSYLVTHHYYLWSPLEPSVIISLATLDLRYVTFLEMMIIPLVLYFIFTLIYLIFFIDSKNFQITENIENVNQDIKSDLYDFSLIILSIFLAAIFNNPLYLCVIYLIVFLILLIKYKIPFTKVFTLIDIGFTLSFLLILILAVLIKNNIIINKQLILTYIEHYNYNILYIIPIIFILSFIFGSSSKYAAITAYATLVIGIKYFPLFYIIDYCAYLLSPLHKCTFFILFKYNKKFMYFILIFCIILSMIYSLYFYTFII